MKNKTIWCKLPTWQSTYPVFINSCYRGFCAPRGPIFSGLHRDNRWRLLGVFLHRKRLLHHLTRLHPELHADTHAHTHVGIWLNTWDIFGVNLVENQTAETESAPWDAYVMWPVDVTLVQCQPLYVCITRNAAVLQRGRNLDEDIQQTHILTS